MSIKKIICAAVILLVCSSAVIAANIAPLYIKKYDLQPYYPAQVKDSYGNAVDITGATIYCTMKNLATGTVKINRQTTGINISDGANGKFEYRWQSGDTNTTGSYSIEFEVNPVSGGKFTVPTNKRAMVIIADSLDSE